MQKSKLLVFTFFAVALVSCGKNKTNKPSPQPGSPEQNSNNNNPAAPTPPVVADQRPAPGGSQPQSQPEQASQPARRCFGSFSHTENRVLAVWSFSSDGSCSYTISAPSFGDQVARYDTTQCDQFRSSIFTFNEACTTLRQSNVSRVFEK